ncbi:WXG100 family type VII secretion target [Microtetraspora malaysiensis]|uniref:WXG100 family type VII secretion target n=1 Tax=Microtetraspora malaysiensis TaxID=161358 RepID=A0ABW6SJQ0_9ACTN
MDTDRKTLSIKTGQPPTAAPATAPTGTDQIAAWLRKCAPAMVSDAGFAYTHAASNIELMTDAIQARAQRLAEAWKGPAAADVQKALRLLTAAGEELATKMRGMSQALRLYGEVHLPKARTEIEQIQGNLQKELPGCYPQQNSSLVGLPPSGATPFQSNTGPSLTDTTGVPSPILSGQNSDGVIGGQTGLPPSLLRSNYNGIKTEGTYLAAKAFADNLARKVLDELNTKIVEVYADHIPPNVTYELPKVSPPDGNSPPRRQVTYGDGSSGSDGGGTSRVGSGGTGGADHSGGSGGSGGSSPRAGSGSGGGGSHGTDGSGTGGGHTGGSGGSGNPGNPGSPEAGGGTTDPSGGAGDPGAPGTGSDPGSAPGTDTGAGPATSTGDGTAPSVIGQNDPAGSDSQSTETAGVRDMPITNPVIGDTNGRLISVDPRVTGGVVTQPGTVAPGNPSILGGPGSGTPGPGGPGLVAPRGPAGSSMPFMPMGGAGAGAAGDRESQERTTWLNEDRDAWDSSHRVIPPVIG